MEKEDEILAEKAQIGRDDKMAAFNDETTSIPDSGYSSLASSSASLLALYAPLIAFASATAALRHKELLGAAQAEAALARTLQGPASEADIVFREPAQPPPSQAPTSCMSRLCA